MRFSLLNYLDVDSYLKALQLASEAYVSTMKETDVTKHLADKRYPVFDIQELTSANAD